MKRALQHGFITGVILALVMGSSLLSQTVSLNTLARWSQYQWAKTLGAIGVKHPATIRVPSLGHAGLSRWDIVRSPEVRTWSRAVSEDIAAIAVYACVYALLGAAVGALWAALFGPDRRMATRRRNAPSRKTVQSRPERHSPVQKEQGRPGAVQNQIQDTSLVQAFAEPDGGPIRASGDRGMASSEPRAGLGESGSQPVAAVESSPLPEEGSVWSGGGVFYGKHWGLRELPFENVPDPRYYFPSSHHEESLHRLLYGVQTRKGAVMLTGEIGCGKTLLSRTLIRHLLTEPYDTALIADPSFGSTQLLREVLYQLGVDASGSEMDLRHRLNDRLLEDFKRGVDTILIIDEAQAIQDQQMFERLRLLLNFQLNERFLLTLVLLGQPELKERVQALPQFYQRIALQYHLGPFTAAEVAEYIQSRLKIAGATRLIFTSAACSLIFRLSGGIPRKINALCDLCLLVGSLSRAKFIDRALVERVAVRVASGRGENHRMTELRPILSCSETVPSI